MITYFYDIKIKDPRAYNTFKRRFYYQMAKTPLAKGESKTKSVIVIENKQEAAADTFFKEFIGFVEVYKTRTQKISRVA